MDKQKQIEEMAKTYCQNGFYCGTTCQTSGCRVYEVCMELYNAGYRKIPKDAVVLTTNEYMKLVNNVEQETAEMFALKLADYFVEHCGGRLSISLTLQEWYKMIDEIVKELTGNREELTEGK